MRVFTKNEYERICYCLMAYPCNLLIVDANNIFSKDMDKNLAISQYNRLVNILVECGVKVQFLDLDSSPSQVFTRDIGFIIENILFISKMTDPLRQSEIKGLIQLAKKHKIKIHLMSHNVEGGDVIVHDNKIFIGQGNRSNERAAEEIAAVLSQNNMEYQIIKVLFDTTKIHLDCVFSILDKDTCLISDDVFKPQNIKDHFSKTIEVPKDQVDILAANIINLGQNRILCCSESLTHILQDHGYHTSFIEFSEVIKVGGSIGCCVLPILREENT
ncbi:amidinotransferase [Alkaliphilus metalliredigens QYMF]|uniref:Amidinotransferase n=1 Tax=Alkaliphilus metalliredigens (strain QYMF) TaxID=293826 RepID=A6TNB2_ALKMQ|nr:arginine deiminase family protein [Alkaliphilus metalliredigens]ABR47680.1 amidinotransferase [Alkaliphilus metalliredigens QYMF]